MSLRSRLLSRSTGTNAAFLSVPKDRGTGSAFGLRRTEHSAPEPELETPKTALPDNSPVADIAQALRQDTDDRPENPDKPLRKAPLAVRRDPTEAIANREERQEEEELQRLPEPAGQEMLTRDDAPVARAPVEVTAPKPVGTDALRTEAKDPPEEEVVQAVQVDRLVPPPKKPPQAAPVAVRPTPPPAVSHLSERSAKMATPAPAPLELGAVAPATLQADVETHPAQQHESLPTDLPSRDSQVSVAEPAGSPDTPHVQAPPTPPHTAPKTPKERPRVVIDQIDVVIGDPNPSGAVPRPAASSASALLARRWLRR